ncbi:MAG: hypothetical protein WCB32_21540, partial [Pseudolabrys sp.]
MLTTAGCVRKADIDRRLGDVRFVPETDIGLIYSITSSARPSSDMGTINSRPHGLSHTLLQ